MLILSYGYKQPEDGDRGSSFFPALNFDIQRLNDHNHDGTNSTKLDGTSIIALSDTISSADWVAVVGQPGTYSQVVNMPAGTLSADYLPKFLVVGGVHDGKFLDLTVNITAAAQYEVFVNDNTLDLKAFYLV